MEGLALTTDSFSFIFVEIWSRLCQQQQRETRQKGTYFFIYQPPLFALLFTANCCLFKVLSQFRYILSLRKCHYAEYLAL